MVQYGWPDCPPSVREQVASLVTGVQTIVGDNLAGVYLHGSLAMGCFNPARSDLDLLVSTDRSMPAEIRREVAAHLLRLSLSPAPIEITFLHRANLHPWRYPTPFDYHYSEAWREQIECDLAVGTDGTWNGSGNLDPDLAAHLTITHHHGIVLHGPPAAERLPDVPPADYLASILADVYPGLERIAEDPVYGVLNACRTYAYLRTGGTFSKAEGGQWTIRRLPAPWREPVETALAHYQGQPARNRFSPDALAHFVSYMKAEIGRLVPNPPA